MNCSSFMKLVHLIDKDARKDCSKADIRTGNHDPKAKIGNITTEIALFCLICWLSGGSFLDVRLLARISRPSFCVCVHRCIRAINSCDALAFHFPKTPQEIREAADGFKCLSSGGVLDKCVGAIDRMLLRTNTPSKKGWTCALFLLRPLQVLRIEHFGRL